MPTFFKSKTTPAPLRSLELLEQFVIDIDEEITRRDVSVLNVPGVKPYHLKLEMQKQEAHADSKITLIYTTKGHLHVASHEPSWDSKPLVMATPDEVDCYYRGISDAALCYKTTNCVGFSAITLQFSGKID